MKKCVFAGTFDPPTVGHKHVVGESLKIFDKVVIAVMVNTDKTPLFTVEERLYLLEWKPSFFVPFPASSRTARPDRKKVSS